MSVPAVIDVPALTGDELAELAGVEQAMTMVRSALVVLDDLRAANPDDPDGMARLVQLTRTLERDIVSLRRAASLDLYTAMTDKIMDIDGVGRIEAKRGRSRKVHDVDAVDQAIWEDACVDAEGEMQDTGHAVSRSMDLMKSVYGITASRKPSITKVVSVLGLDPDDVAEWVEGTPSVVMPPTPA